MNTKSVPLGGSFVATIDREGRQYEIIKQYGATNTNRINHLPFAEKVQPPQLGSKRFNTHYREAMGK
jgi:hypothetical protein